VVVVVDVCASSIRSVTIRTRTLVVPVLCSLSLSSNGLGMFRTSTYTLLLFCIIDLLRRCRYSQIPLPLRIDNVPTSRRAAD
jgi:hypothetical protein